MKPRIPTQDEISAKLRSLARGSHREAVIDSGGYDGRFKTRVEKPKKHRDPKYKHKLYEY